MNTELKITARNDYAFKTLFSRYDNKNIFIEFVSLVTGIKAEDFEEIELQDKELMQIYFGDKFGIVDVKARLKDGTKINIEMQNRYNSYYPRRSLYYWSKIYTQDIKQAEEYNSLNKTISINLLNERFDKSNKLQSIFRIYEEQEHTLLDDALEIHYLDMTKLKDYKQLDKQYIEKLSELEKWLLFLQTDRKEVRKMLSNQNMTLEKADKVMEMFYSDDMEREMYDTAEKYEMDKYFMHLSGIEKGIEQGKKEGIEQGKKEGIEQGKKEIALNLLNQGIDLSIIQTSTGLSKEEILSLK